MNEKKFVLLHSNDMHGDFLPHDVDGKVTAGLARLSGYINQVRKEKKNTMNAYAQRVLENLKAEAPWETEFLQSVTEVFESLCIWRPSSHVRQNVLFVDISFSFIL